MDEHEVTQLIERAREGDGQAQHRLFGLYFRRLVALARARFGGQPPRGADAEDVALSAMNSFFEGLPEGEFSRLEDRDDLRHLLFAITSNKAANLLRHEGARRRGGGVLRGESALAGPGTGSEAGIDQAPSARPGPEFEVAMAEECDALLGLLSGDLRRAAELKLEGFTHEEIARQMGKTPRTVERWVQGIRDIWGCKLEAECRPGGTSPN